MSDEVDVNEGTETTKEIGGKMDITAKVRDTGAEATFSFTFPGTALEAIEAYGDSVVLDCFIRQAVVRAQAVMRQHLNGGKSADEVAQYMADNWKPGVRLSDASTSIAAKFGAMTPEQRRELLEQLAAMAG